MSALAELFIRRGVKVTGCDARPEGAADLVRLGVQSHRTIRRTSMAPARLSSPPPCRKPIPQLARARELGILVIRRAEPSAK